MVEFLEVRESAEESVPVHRGRGVGEEFGPEVEDGYVDECGVREGGERCESVDAASLRDAEGHLLDAAGFVPG